MLSRLHAAGLAEIDEKLRAHERLTFDDGVRLFECPDLLAVGWLANRDRERRHGARTYFNYNLRLEPTNVCEASCLFCSFARLRATGRTILLVEENAARVIDDADHIYLLDNGEFVWNGAGVELMSRPEIVATYLGG